MVKIFFTFFVLIQRLASAAEVRSIDLTSLTQNGRPLNNVSIKQGELRAFVGAKKVSSDKQHGIQMSALDSRGQKILLQIAGVNQGSINHFIKYEVEYLSESKFLKVCSPNNQGETSAFLVAGVWNEKGEFEKSDRLGSLACTNGAIGKCILWGYPPQSAANLHQACVRMVRADFLGTGESYTVPGVELFFFNAEQTPQPSIPRGMLFEALWGPNGALKAAKPRVRDLIPPGCKTISQCPFHTRQKGLIISYSHP